MTNILTWLINLHIIPDKWMAKGLGWISIITAIACMLGHPLPFMPCTPTQVPSAIADSTVFGLNASGVPVPLPAPVAPTPSSPSDIHLLMVLIGLGLVALGRVPPPKKDATGKVLASAAHPISFQAS